MQYAVVRSKTAHKDPLDVQIAQLFVEVGALETGIGIHFQIESLLDDGRAGGKCEGGVELGALAAYNAVGWPRPPIFDERGVGVRVPVLGGENSYAVGTESGSCLRSLCGNFGAGFDGQRTAGAEVVLHVDDYQGVCVIQLHSVTPRRGTGPISRKA